MSEMLSAMIKSQHLGVDRETNTVRGVVIAQEGPFKTKGRGAFDVGGLKKITALMNKEPKGLISRLGHPDVLGINDSALAVVGRMKNPRMDHVSVMRDGEKKSLHAVRADLKMYDFAMAHSPNGGTPVGARILDMLDEDPSTLSTSLVIQPRLEYQVDPKTKRQALDADGEPLPPLWTPVSLHASDIVGCGEAVDSMLAALSAESPIALGLAPDEYDFAMGTPHSELNAQLEDELSRLHSQFDAEDAADEAIYQAVKLAEGMDDRVGKLRQQILGRERQLFVCGFGHLLRSISDLPPSPELWRLERCEESLDAALSALSCVNHHRNLGLFV